MGQSIEPVQDEFEKDLNTSMENVISTVCEQSNSLNKDLRSSMDSVIDSVCDHPQNLLEHESSNSRLSPISNKSSSCGRVSRMSCRSNSSTSLPSSQLEITHKKDQ